ncbi:RagB/SusD family nutrient uptake outer membrane protein [Prolixibacteraceae bacterium JC049]|nr:RagB/SusD family nutrient uptake outer membrane protein [Prolixibacteraceae bacterium JC049]
MKYKFIIIIVSILVLTACEKDLNLFPKTELSTGSFFLKEKDFKLFANQFYDYLPGFGTCGRDEWSDITFDGSSISNGTYTEPNTSSLYNGCYDRIRKTNDMLEAIEGVEDEQLKKSVSVYKGEALFFRALQYWFLYRDFGGVIIVDKPLGVEDPLLYGTRNSRKEVVDFILNDLNEALKTDVGTLSGTKNEGRITREAVLALKARVALFEGTWVKYHNTGADANAYLQQAIDASGAILDGGKFQLFDRRDVLGEDSYRYFFTLETERKTNPAGLGKEDQNEIILANKYSQKLRNRGSSWVVVAWDDLSPTRKMMDMYLDANGLPITNPNSIFKGYLSEIDPVTKRGTNWEYVDRDPRIRANHVQPFHQYWYDRPYAKTFEETAEQLIGTGYFHDGWSISSLTGYVPYKFCNEIERPIANDYPVFRLAEMMLIFAEASFEKNGSITDAELNKSINMLRDRVGMPHLTNAFVATNSLDMKEEIRRERTVELFMEGFRYDDLRRWKTAEVEMPKAILGMKWGGNMFESKYEVFDLKANKVVEVDNSKIHKYAIDADGFLIIEDASKRFWESKHYLRPLPLLELEKNKNLTQNSGWIGSAE